MIEYNNTIEGKEMADKLSKSLSWCHNMLRSQEKMTSESAFKELNKLLYIKYITEYNSKEREKLQTFLSGKDQIYPDQRFEHLFDEVKKIFDQERLFDFAEHILAKSMICENIIEYLSFFNFSYASTDIGKAYEEFSYKVMRNIDNAIAIPRSISEFIVDILNIKPNNNVIDPFCGNGCLLSAVASQLPMGHSGKLIGYDDDRLMAQTAKMNMLMYGNKDAIISADRVEKDGNHNKYDFVISYLSHSKSENYQNENVRNNIMNVLNLAVQGGYVAVITADDFLQGDRFENLRNELLDRATMMSMVSLPATAIRMGGKPIKSSILFMIAGHPHAYNREVMQAKVEDMGISAIGLPSEKNDFKKIEPVMLSWLHGGQANRNENIIFTNLICLDRWDIQAEFAKEDYCLFSKYPRFRLGDLVKVNDFKLEKYTKKEYSLVSVRQNKHDIVFRKKITAKQLAEKKKRYTVISSGQFVVSRIGAKDGAIGIVPKDLDGSLVSDNFLVLKMVSKIIEPYYLLMVLTSERYKNMLRGISRGVTNRSYIRTRDLLSLTIPVPDIEVQRNLIGNLQEIQQRIGKLEKQWADGISQFSKELFEE